MRTALLALCLLAACGPPDHQNPFDPSTPPALQARATLTGSVTLEPRGAAPPSPAGVDVSVAGVGTVTTDAAGAFSLPGVPPGTHAVLLRRAGWDDLTVLGIVVTLDDGDRVVAVPPVRLALSRGHVAGTVTLAAGAVAGFPVGADRSGTVVTLEAAGEPTRTAVTDASGAFRFEAIPASLPGTSYVLTARRPFFLPASGTVAAVAGETATAPGLAVEVAAAALSGVARATNVVAGDDAIPSNGTAITVRGTAFNGAPWATAAVTGIDGAWTTGALPPGTYDVVAGVDGRACGAYARRVVESGVSADAGAVICLDAIPPGALALAAPPIPPRGQPGYAATTSVTVQIAAQASDATVPSNLAGYETTVGAAADFSGAPLTPATATSLTFSSLAPNARSVLWARPVDSAGNAGVPVAVEVIHDGVAPPTPTLSTPSALVPATTTSATLTGSESDATFHHYETCQVTVGARAACPASPPQACAFAPSPASAAVPLAAGQRTCLYARAVDAAGNLSGTALRAVVSDLTPPPVPALAPIFDPTKLTVRADSVDFFVTGASVDEPAGTLAWEGIAWLEADSGAGFEPLCAEPACRTGGRWQPCACGCTDPRLLCRGTAFHGVRVPLLGGLANRLGLRALDAAGNYGPGVGQSVVTAGLEGFIGASGTVDEGVPRLRGRLLAYLEGMSYRLVDLGANARHDAGDVSCLVGTRGSYAPGASAEAASPTLVVHATSGGTQVAIRRAGAGGFCTGEASQAIHTFGGGDHYIPTVTGSGERVAWVEAIYSAPYARALRLREPGADGLLGGTEPWDDVTLQVEAGVHVAEVQLAPGVLAYRRQVDAASPVTARVLLADPATGSFAGQAPQDLAAGASAIAVSADGTRLAHATAAGLTVRSPGPDRRWLTGDDVVATRPLPGRPIRAGSLTVEGAHLVAIEGGGGQLVHWYAGGDGVFTSSGGDDTISRMLPSANDRLYPSLGSGLTAGYLVYQVNDLPLLTEQTDVLSADLTQLRWEAVGVGGAVPLVRSDGRGTLFSGFSGGISADVQARTTDGRTSPTRTLPARFDVSGDDLVAPEAGGLAVSGPGPNGLWFDADDPAPVTIHAGTFTKVVVADGKAGALRVEGGSWIPYVYEPDPAATPAPGMGPVSTATPILLGPGTTESWFHHVAVAGPHAFWSCGARPNLRICYRWAGPDGRFGTADDGAVVTALEKPSHPGVPFNPEFCLRASGERLLVLDNGAFPGVYLVTPGPDGVFGDGADADRFLGPGSDETRVDLAGAWLAVSGASAEAPGEQITLHDLAGGGSREVTATYSSKDMLTLEPSGRVYWHDTIFADGAVFVFEP